MEVFSGFVNECAADGASALGNSLDPSPAGLLEGVRQPEHLRLSKRRAEDLQPDRQSLGRLTGRHGDAH